MKKSPACIFAKPPVAGAVKTRLIPHLGAEGAAELARAMLMDVWRTVESCERLRPVLATTSDSAAWPVQGDVWQQGEGDLGARIERVMIRGLQERGAVLAIGADTPALRLEHLEAALAALAASDAVVGPSVDGGFYLLGLRNCEPALLADLPWSCNETLRALKARFAERSMTVTQIETLFDVDVPHDLLLLREHLSRHAGAEKTRLWCASASSFPR